MFGPTVGLQLVFITLRASLSICQDFQFLAWAASGVFVVVYIPCILVARFVFNTAVGYYVAMYMPHFVMILVFGARMWGHLARLRVGGEGPWTAHQDHGVTSARPDTRPERGLEGSPLTQSSSLLVHEAGAAPSAYGLGYQTFEVHAAHS